IIWLEGIFIKRFLPKPNRVHLKYDKSYQLPYTRCSFIVCGLYNDNPVTNLDPRLPPIFSNVLRLVTVHEGLVHPPITFRLWLGILSSRAFPEFGNLP
ncbi:hypothetical protein COCHEDRAFT_56715, partial [Bipolaris maydis C5]